MRGIQPAVQDAIDTLISEFPSLPILVTGHSLGGALSTLCAADIMTKCNPKYRKKFFSELIFILH
jgi:alpha-beta hydrolase superfamily lysophospholipase